MYIEDTSTNDQQLQFLYVLINWKLLLNHANSNYSESHAIELYVYELLITVGDSPKIRFREKTTQGV